MKIDAQQLIAALDAIEETKGISRDATIELIKDSLARVCKKQLGLGFQTKDGTKTLDPDVRVEIDLDKGEINTYYVRYITNEVNDDALEISLEDVKTREAEKLEATGFNSGIEYNYGDEYKEVINLESPTNALLNSIKAVMRQHVNEAERNAIHAAFQDKLNSIIVGKITAIDERGAAINIGKNNVYLQRKDMIGDENFEVGKNIKIFLSEEKLNGKGVTLHPSRANEGFLKALFNEEITEIYNGTIEIKAIARRASERSKVAVYSKEPGMDAAAVTIGGNGSKIQKITSQLGESASMKEKVDVINWYADPALFIIETLKPAELTGLYVDIDEEGKANYATVVVKDDSLSKAIGRKGVNIWLASKLTGFKLDIVCESEAIEKGLKYTPIAEFEAKRAEVDAQKQKMALEAALNKAVIESLPGVDSGYVAPQNRVYENEANEIDETLAATIEDEEIETPVVNKVNETPVVNASSEVEEDNSVVSVKVTTSISDLENNLENASKKSSGKDGKKKYSKSNDKKDEKEETVVNPQYDNKMSIYTEEELAEMENEEEDTSYDDDDKDYSDYDDDSYYDK